MNLQKRKSPSHTQSIQQNIYPSNLWLSPFQKNSFKLKTNFTNNNQNISKKHNHKNENFSTCSIENQSQETIMKSPSFIKKIQSSSKFNENSHQTFEKLKSFASIGNLEENNLQENYLTKINFLNKSQLNWSVPSNNHHGLVNNNSNLFKSRVTLQKSQSNLFDGRNDHVKKFLFQTSPHSKINKNHESHKRSGSLFKSIQKNHNHPQSNTNMKHSSHFPFKKNIYIKNSYHAKFNTNNLHLNSSMLSCISNHSNTSSKTKMIKKQKYNLNHIHTDLIKQRMRYKKKNIQNNQFNIVMNYNCFVSHGFYMNVECQPKFFEQVSSFEKYENVVLKTYADSSCEDYGDVKIDKKLKIIKKNSILNDKWSHHEFKFRDMHIQQVNNSVDTITHHLFTNTHDFKLNKQNILTCINLQLNLPSYQLQNFNFNSKLRLFIYIYSKFFNRLRICEKVDDLLPFINLSDYDSTLKYILTE